ERTEAIENSRDLKSSRSEQSEKIAVMRADRNVAAADSKASAADLRSQAQSERTKARELAKETALSKADAKSRELEEGRSRSAA
ncbi:hypothetical protein, partial [Methanothrix soehngenii]|nr:hypothetical protein [Methanothrix soehngenii]